MSKSKSVELGDQQEKIGKERYQIRARMIFLGWGPKCPPFFGALIFFLATIDTNGQRRRPAEEDGDIGWRVAVAVL